MIFILHTSTLNLPEGSIGNAHGHSHSHSHRHEHHHHHQAYRHHHSPYRGQKHKRSSSIQGEQTAKERGHEHHFPKDNHYLHQSNAANSSVHCSDFAPGSINLAGEDIVCAASVDSAETTSIELSSTPLACNGNGPKYHQQHDG